MKFSSQLLFFALFAIFWGNSHAAEPIRKGDVVVAPLSGEVSDAQAAFLRRSLKQAESVGASAFVIEMNTPGGELQAAVDILQLLLKARIPTYTWVNTNAGSAGAHHHLFGDAGVNRDDVAPLIFAEPESVRGERCAIELSADA